MTTEAVMADREAGQEQEAFKLGKRLPAIIHFDTGMNRLGLDEWEVRTLMKEPFRLNNLEVDLIARYLERLLQARETP